MMPALRHWVPVAVPEALTRLGQRHGRSPMRCLRDPAGRSALTRNENLFISLRIVLLDTLPSDSRVSVLDLTTL